MQLVVANRPLGVAVGSYLLLGLLVVYPHENLVGPPRKIDQPSVDINTFDFGQKRKLLKDNFLLKRLQLHQKVI